MYNRFHFHCGFQKSTLYCSRFVRYNQLLHDEISCAGQGFPLFSSAGYQKIQRRITAFPFILPSTEGIILRVGGSGIACPGFSVLRFRREFLSRM